jgi:hypothetical protein
VAEPADRTSRSFRAVGGSLCGTALAATAPVRRGMQLSPVARGPAKRRRRTNAAAAFCIS